MRQPNQLKELETYDVLRNFFRSSPVLLILACVWLWYAKPAYGREVIDVAPAPLQEQKQEQPQRTLLLHTRRTGQQRTKNGPG